MNGAFLLATVEKLTDRDESRREGTLVVGGYRSSSGAAVTVMAKETAVSIFLQTGKTRRLFPWRPANSHISSGTTGLPVVPNDWLIQMLQTQHQREMAPAAGLKSSEDRMCTRPEVTSQTNNVPPTSSSSTFLMLH